MLYVKLLFREEWSVSPDHHQQKGDFGLWNLAIR